MKPIFLLTLLVSGIGSFCAAADGDAKEAAPPPAWTNITETFTKEIGVDEAKPIYHRRCSGLIVTPNGDLVMQSATKGVYRSTDQGATWTAAGGDPISGRCETGDGFSLAYPYDGRMAFFCCDGTGGISLDDGKTWRAFGRFHRSLEFADADWSQKDPQLIVGATHEPYVSVLSEDGGRTWRRLFTETEDAGRELSFLLGVIDAKTLVRAPAKHAGIEISSDLGQTWTKAGDYKVLGRRPVHYGKKVYWTTSEGVISSSDGKDWAVTGPGAENANYGPYFGASEQEFMVVTAKSFLATADGGKTWRTLAPTLLAPDGFRPTFRIYADYGWDSKRRILYASNLGSSVYRLQLP
jgi:hypothetical protein